MSVTFIASAKVESVSGTTTLSLTVPTGVTTSHFGVLWVASADSTAETYTITGWNSQFSNPAGENNETVALFTRMGGVAAGNTISVTVSSTVALGMYAAWYDTSGREIQAVGTPWTKGGTSQTTITYNPLTVPGARDILLTSVDRTLTAPTISSWSPSTPTLDAYINSTDRTALGHNVTFAHYAQAAAGATPTFVETMSNGAGNAVAVQIMLGASAPLWLNTDFEGGTNGANLTASNQRFTNIAGAAGTWTFSNAHVVPVTGGLFAAKAAATGTSISLNNFSSLWTAATKLYYRFYVYVETMPSANSDMATWRSGSTTIVEAPRITTTGSVVLRNASTTAVYTSPTGIIAAGSFYRFEGMIDVTNAQQQIKIFIGSNVDGNTADYDSGVVTSSMGASTTIDNFLIGVINAATATYHFDNASVFDASYGFAGPLTLPVASASSTGDAKIWNGTAWVAKPVKVWNGAAWVQKPVKVWNGTTWVTTTY